MQQGQAAHKALFGEDIEEEANSHFQRIYMSEIEIGEVVDMLSRLELNNNNNNNNITTTTTTTTATIIYACKSNNKTAGKKKYAMPLNEFMPRN